MLAAAVTLWTMFSLWLIAPHAQMPERVARVAGMLCVGELLALLVWSYGTDACTGRTCAPIAQALGIAARVDIPALAAAFVVFACVRWLRAQPGPP
jgi:hypothetical protein